MTQFVAKIAMENSAMMDADDVQESIIQSVPEICGGKKNGLFRNRRGETVGNWKITDEPVLIANIAPGAPDTFSDDTSRCSEEFFDSDGDPMWECTRSYGHDGFHVACDGEEVLSSWMTAW